MEMENEAAQVKRRKSADLPRSLKQPGMHHLWGPTMTPPYILTPSLLGTQSCLSEPRSLTIRPVFQTSLSATPFPFSQSNLSHGGEEGYA